MAMDQPFTLLARLPNDTVERRHHFFRQFSRPESPIVAGQGAKKIDRTLLITHHFKFHRILEAYDTFARASETSALKVIIDM